MRPFPFVPRIYYFSVIRVSLGLIMATHGIHRILERGIAPFGDFLSAQGFPLGFLIAWLVTIFEIAGGLTLALSWFRRGLSALFIFELLMGLMVINVSNCCYIAGYSLGGIEYNVLLIICFLMVAAEE